MVVYHAEWGKRFADLLPIVEELLTSSPRLRWREYPVHTGELAPTPVESLSGRSGRWPRFEFRGHRGKKSGDRLHRGVVGPLGAV